jgi:hypothetical protein
MWKVDINPIRTTAIVAGAGAVENAWSPIIKALQPFVDFPLTADGVNSFLARQVYLLRWFASSENDFSKKELEKQLEEFRKIKSSIIKELRSAQKCGEIKARASLPSLIDKLVIPFGSQFMLITTNWDTVIPKAMQDILSRDFNVKIIPHHIHGNITKLSTMYMPSEVTRELYREKRHDIEIGSKHGTAWRALESA